jgi:hypothetical protein
MSVNVPTTLRTGHVVTDEEAAAILESVHDLHPNHIRALLDTREVLLQALSKLHGHCSEACPYGLLIRTARGQL